MALNAALPGQPYPLVDEKRCLTPPWYNALVRLGREASLHVVTFKMDFPPISYPFVDADKTISDGWYNSILGLAVAAATIGGLKAAVPGQPYPTVDEKRLITLPWYNALVVIANDLI